MTHDVQKTSKQLEDTNAQCARLRAECVGLNAECAGLNAECARLREQNQVTVCTVMCAHLLVRNVHVLLQEK